MRVPRLLASALTLLALAGCGSSSGGTTSAVGFELPVGPVEWDAGAPAWFHDGTLHVGERSVELDGQVDEFVVGATGAYWMSGQTLMFTSAEGDTEVVEAVGWANLAVSADRSVLATVDQSRGPTDRYGTHVLQVVAFDTRTGEQLYRTPDEEPDEDDDLAALYPEIMPLLEGVSSKHLFFDDATIDLEDGSVTPAGTDSQGLEAYDGYAETLFPDGYHVGIRGDGRQREQAESELFGVGRLSPDRTVLFDLSQWPTEAVAYDAETGEQLPIDAPWRHFSLTGWSDGDTFYGVAERIDVRHPSDVLRARQVVTCELRTLACSPVSPVIPTGVHEDGGTEAFLVEGSALLF